MSILSWETIAQIASIPGCSALSSAVSLSVARGFADGHLIESASSRRQTTSCHDLPKSEKTVVRSTARNERCTARGGAVLDFYVGSSERLRAASWFSPHRNADPRTSRSVFADVRVNLGRGHEGDVCIH